MKKILPLFTIIFAALFFNSCQKIDKPFSEAVNASKVKGYPGNVATDWYKLQLRLSLERNSTMNGAYYGYLGIGLYESIRHGIVNSVSFSSKLYQMPEMPALEKNKDYQWQVSANAAMASLLRFYNTGLTPANIASIDSLENAWNKKFNAIAPWFGRSQAYGRSVATAVYNWSLTDNFNPSNAGYNPPVFFGAWVPTPPALANGIMPYLKLARPYLASNINSVAPAYPFAYSETVNTDFYNIAKQVYDVSLTLTQDQKDIALFWVDQGNGVGYTPNGHQISIVIQALEKQQSSLFVAAETFAKAGIAMRDATIICFKSKYEYNLIRPVTYIRNFIDPNWLPFVVTPPHPEYPSAHSFITGSIMQAVSHVLGNNVSITDHTYDFRGYPSRTYTTLFKAAEEAGAARLYGGIHYEPSCTIALGLGLDLGNKIGAIKLHP